MTICSFKHLEKWCCFPVKSKQKATEPLLKAEVVSDAIIRINPTENSNKPSPKTVTSPISIPVNPGLVEPCGYHNALAALGIK